MKRILYVVPLAYAIVMLISNNFLDVIMFLDQEQLTLLDLTILFEFCLLGIVSWLFTRLIDYVDRLVAMFLLALAVQICDFGFNYGIAKRSELFFEYSQILSGLLNPLVTVATFQLLVSQLGDEFNEMILGLLVIVPKLIPYSLPQAIDKAFQLPVTMGFIGLTWCIRPFQDSIEVKRSKVRMSSSITQFLGATCFLLASQNLTGTLWDPSLEQKQEPLIYLNAVVLLPVIFVIRRLSNTYRNKLQTITIVLMILLAVSSRLDSIFQFSVKIELTGLVYAVYSSIILPAVLDHPRQRFQRTLWLTLAISVASQQSYITHPSLLLIFAAGFFTVSTILARKGKIFRELDAPEEVNQSQHPAYGQIEQERDEPRKQMGVMELEDSL